jgi:hypothetical protein
MNTDNQTVEQAMGWDSPQGNPHIKYYWNVAQHTDEWLALKKGVISASTMKNLISKKTDKDTGEVTYSLPKPDKTKSYLYQIASERFAPELVEDDFQSFAMMRGVRDEVDAFNLYSAKYEPLRSCGFITNDEHGFTLGFSPDGLTALHDDGFTEAKSRAPKFQFETIATDEMDDDYMIQIQVGFLVTKRKWCDFKSYCGGLPMFVKRIYPDPVIQKVIIEAGKDADKRINEIVDTFKANVEKYKFHPTIQRVEDITP